MQRLRLLRAALSLRAPLCSEIDNTTLQYIPLIFEAVQLTRPAPSHHLITAPAAAQATFGRQCRPFSASSALLDATNKAGGAEGGAAPPVAAGAASRPTAANGQHEEDLEDEEGAEDAMAEAFERLIQAAFEMVTQGKPMEAEYVLSEGAKQAEEILGKDALEVAALYDQLCVIQFLHDRIPEASESAKRAMDILRVHDEGFGPATAIAATRYASTLLALGNPQEAQLHAGRSIDGLERAAALLEELAAQEEGADGDEELEETRAKFDIGLGESRYYHGLAKQAQNLEPAAVGQHVDEMRQGLELMTRRMGPDNPITMAALREHNRLIIAALDEEKQDLAEALYKQDVELIKAASGDAENLALTQYQLGTLQYVMGKYEDAATCLQSALETVRSVKEGAEEHLLTVQQRLGQVTALLGRYERARQLLQEVAPALQASLGEGNPASEELEFMLSWISLKEMEQDGVTDPARRQACLDAMQKHLEALQGYGEGHMLVQKAQELHAEAKGPEQAEQTETKH